MFTQTIDIREVELANKCNARCPQCPRYDDGRLRPGLNKDEITLQTFTNIDKDIIKNLKTISFKGTTGDPIISKDFFSIIEYIRSINQTLEIEVATNGGLHDVSYWQELAKLMSLGFVTFGIDGLAGIHEKYRIGTDFGIVIRNAQRFIQAGGRARWQFIIFDHNEHQQELCKQKSIELGFEKFEPIFSDRFTTVSETKVQDKNETYSLKPSSQYTQNKKATSVKCESFLYNYIFIYADGSVWPCCYLGGITNWGKENPYMAVDISMIKKHVMQEPGGLNINEQRLSDILQSENWNKWSWVFGGDLQRCREYCGGR